MLLRTSPSSTRQAGVVPYILAASAVVASCFACTTIAFAQDVTTSAAMFDRGVADMERGHFDTACPAIAESLRLDPRPGTLFTLAECYAKAGKSASAVARYGEYLDQVANMPADQRAKQMDRPQISQQQIDFLKPRVPLLTVRLPPGAPAGTVVKRDGVVVGGPSLGVALPIDPGHHQIVVEAPGHAPGATQVDIAVADKKNVVAALGAVTSDQSGAAPVTGSPTPTKDSGLGAQRIAGITMGSVGIAGLLVGAIAGGVTLSKKSSVKDHCDFDTKRCDDDASLDTLSSARASGTASTVGFVVGGALFGGGLVVFLTAPSNAAASEPAKKVGLGFSAGPWGGAGSIKGSF